MSLTLLFLLLAVFVITYGTVLLLIKYSEPLGLLAYPGEHRQHLKPTPMVGGLAIFIGLCVGLVSLGMVGSSAMAVMPALALLCVVGAIDDRYTLPSWLRFVAQALAAYLMIKLTGIKLENLGFLIQDSEVWLGKWSTAMTIFACIGVINAVNMSDGHDGLAGSLTLIVLIALLLFSDVAVDAVLIMVSIAALLAFLSFNVRLFRAQARIFMGDAGSTMLGLLLAYLLIQYSQLNNSIRPVTALWLLALPLIDAVAVLLVRPLRGRSPFSADRIHYHHQLIDYGFSINKTVVIAIMLQILFIGIGVWMWKQGVADYIQLNVFLTLFGLYVLRLFWFTRHKKQK